MKLIKTNSRYTYEIQSDYKPGDEISFYIKGYKSKITDEIIDFRDSLILFKGNKIHVNDIVFLHIDQKTRWWIRYNPGKFYLLPVLRIYYWMLLTAGNSKKKLWS